MHGKSLQRFIMNKSNVISLRIQFNSEQIFDSIQVTIRIHTSRDKLAEWERNICVYIKCIESWFRYRIPFAIWNWHKWTDSSSFVLYISIYIQSNYPQILGLFMKWNRCIEGECVIRKSTPSNPIHFNCKSFSVQHRMCECKHNVFDDFPNI